MHENEFRPGALTGSLALTRDFQKNAGCLSFSGTINLQVGYFTITFLRALLGIFLGAVAVFVLVMAVEMFSSVVHPFPEGMDLNDMEEMCEHVARYPDWVLAAVVGLWGFSAFLGTWIAQKVGSYWASGVEAALILWAVLFNLSMLPYAVWFKVVMPMAVVVAIAAAFGLARSFKRAV